MCWKQSLPQNTGQRMLKTCLFSSTTKPKVGLRKEEDGERHVNQLM